MTKMISLSEFEYYGFKIEEIGPWLLKHGIDIGLSTSPSDGKPQTEEPWPYWRVTLSLHPHLTLREAASAFADIDLYSAGWLSDDEGAELNRWEGIITRAVLADEIEVDPHSIKWGAQGGLESADIKPDELQKWCSKKGIGYPLPTKTPLPQTDAGLREALSNAETELVQLKAKIAKLEVQEDQRAQLQAEIDRLRAEVGAKAECDKPLHIVRLMQAAIRVQHEHWQDLSAPANQESVLLWLSKEYPLMSDADRKAVEKVACPIDRNPAKK